MLRTNRGLLKFILLNLITFGIYSIVMFSNISEEINLTASRDGSLIIVGPFIFYHKFLKAVNMINADYNAGLPTAAGV